MGCAKHPETESAEHARIRHDRTGKAVYSQDLFDAKIRAFIRDNRDRPFFLYHPSQLPHGPISIPELHPAVADHPDLTQFEKEYASMVLRLDATVGLILDELEAAGVADRTLLIFCSDNGHEFYCRQPGRTGDQWTAVDGTKLDNITGRFTSQRCGDVFDGNDGMAGLKITNWEGGTRIPYLVAWPARTPPGTVCDRMFANCDLFPTFAELLGIDMPPGKDGVSLLPIWRGREPEQEHGPIVTASFLWGPSLVTADGWKLRRINNLDRFQLYYLPDDYQEAHDLAAQYPERVDALAARMLEACDGSYDNGCISTHFAQYDHEVVNDYLRTRNP
ncbi:sulfatase-like hydrolase/transferase [Planctomycetota bacterium]